MPGRTIVFVAAICALCALSACAAQPRTRPLRTTLIADGPATMEATRKALEGRWVLVTLTANTDNGRSAVIDATGAMTSDAFGNLQVEYRMSDAGQRALAGLGIKSPNPVVSTSGRVAIDPQQERITYVGDDFEKRAFASAADLAVRRANPFALERTRYYVLGDDGTLLLSTRYDTGKDAVVSRWKKGS